MNGARSSSGFWEATTLRATQRCRTSMTTTGKQCLAPWTSSHPVATLMHKPWPWCCRSSWTPSTKRFGTWHTLQYKLNIKGPNSQTYWFASFYLLLLIHFISNPVSKLLRSCPGKLGLFSDSFCLLCRWLKTFLTPNISKSISALTNNTLLLVLDTHMFPKLCKNIDKYTYLPIHKPVKVILKNIDFSGASLKGISFQHVCGLLFLSMNQTLVCTKCFGKCDLPLAC